MGVTWIRQFCEISYRQVSHFLIGD